LQTLEPLEARDFASAGSLLAEAFHDNPAHIYLFPDEGRRARTLGWLLRRNLEVQAPLAHGFCISRAAESPAGRRVVAMGFWHAPGEPTVSPRALLRPGFLAVPLRCGLDTTRRMIEITGILEEEKRRAVGSTPVWFLNNMVVSKELRGSGVGSEMLGRELRERIDPTGQAAALATQRPENVSFYRRLGFEVAGFRERSGRHSPPFPNWTMVRPPAFGG
jgi:GNAT superfamily N-acetyltransferase